MLWTRVRLKKPGMTSMLSNRFKPRPDGSLRRPDPDDDHAERDPDVSWPRAIVTISSSPARPARRRSGRRCPAHSGSVRTDGTNRQQRAHFTPGAFSTSTSTVSAPSVEPTVSRHVRDDEAASAARARCRSSSAADRPCAVMTTRAPSEVPMTLSLRFCSSAALTCSRTLQQRVPRRRAARDR